MDVLLKSRIDDYWNVDGGQELRHGQVGAHLTNIQATSRCDCS